MNKHKHTIFAFVGASGSGKSTLMIELLNFFPHLQIIKSTTTRPRRDDGDLLFYKFVDPGYIESPENQTGFLTHEIYSGNHYVWEKEELDSVLRTHCGMFAIIEHTVPKLRDLGYDLTLIKVLPERGWDLERARAREKVDRERESQSDLKYDFTVRNSFEAGGLEKSVQKLSGFIVDRIGILQT